MAEQLTPQPNLEQPHYLTPTDVALNLVEAAGALAACEDRNEAPLHYTAKQTLQEYGVRSLLESGEYSAEELDQVLSGLHAIDMATGGTPEAWKFINYASDSPAMHELSGQENTSLDDIMQHAVQATGWRQNSLVYRDLLRAGRHATLGRFGGISRWCTKGHVAKTNAPIEELTAHNQFAYGYIRVASEIVEKDKQLDPAEKMLAMRDAERALLEDILGLSAETVQDIQFAIAARTLRRKDGRILDLSEGGGIDGEEWRTVMRNFVSIVEEFGAANIQQLREKCGIVNFDHYNLEQLERMRLLTAEKLETPEEIAAFAELVGRLQKHDVRIVIKDAFGDTTNAMKDVPETLETRNDTALFLEVPPLATIGRVLDKLHSLGIKPASMAFTAHGSLGYMRVGRDPHEFHIVGRRKRGANSRLATPREIPLRGIRLGHILNKYFRPRRDTGEREVILLSCLQANAGGRGSERLTPTAEQFAYETDPSDNVVVYAAAGEVGIERTPAGNLQYVQGYPEHTIVETAIPCAAIAFRSAYTNRRSRNAGRIVTHRTVKTIPGM